jgi:hypothetical protein
MFFDFFVSPNPMRVFSAASHPHRFACTRLHPFGGVFVSPPESPRDPVLASGFSSPRPAF